jgi:hypothetical protein
MKRLCTVFLGAIVATAVIGRPAAAGRSSSPNASGPETPSDVSDLRLPNPRQELRHLSENLNLRKDQRADVSVILEERAREIHLLFDIESLSEEHRNVLAAKVMEDSNAQIEALLRSKQKRKFDKDLAKDHEVR